MDPQPDQTHICNLELRQNSLCVSYCDCSVLFYHLFFLCQGKAVFMIVAVQVYFTDLFNAIVSSLSVMSGCSRDHSAFIMLSRIIFCCQLQLYFLNT